MRYQKKEKKKRQSMRENEMERKPKKAGIKGTVQILDYTISGFENMP